MTFPQSPETRQLQDQQPTARPAPLTQSREFRNAIPHKKSGASAVAGQSSPFAKSWVHFVAGGLGALTAATATAPFDVLKTRLQSDYYQNYLAASRASRGIPCPSTISLPRSALLHFRETLQILGAIPRTEGWGALFKGLGPNLAGVIPARSIHFYTYGNGKRIISTYFNNGQESSWVHVAAAATAGVITGTATNPIWVIKTRLQLDKSHAKEAHAGRQYKNALDCTVKTVRHEGIRGLYRGLTASFLGISETAIQWVLYERMKLYIAERQERVTTAGLEPTAWDKTLEWTGIPVASGIAKLVATVLTYPHEVVRTRLRQAPMDGGHLKYTGLIQCFHLMLKEEGFHSMYGGLTPHLFRVVPNAAIMFGVYEVTLRLLGTTSHV